MKRTWWLSSIRGLLAILFGLIVLLSPNISLRFLIVAFGIYVITEGVLAISSAFLNHAGILKRLSSLIQGISSIIIGFVIILLPNMTAILALFIIAIFAIVRGALEIAKALEEREEMGHQWLLWLSALVSIVFGALLISQPDTGILAVLTIFGIYAIVSGIITFWSSFRVRKYQIELDDLSGDTPIFS